MTSFIAVCIREGETLEQSGSQAIASKVVDCKYSVQFAYVFSYFTHYRSLIQPSTWSKWNLYDFSDIMADFIHVEANSEVQQNSIYAGRRERMHTYLLQKREDVWHKAKVCIQTNVPL